jgi:recombination protein RecT
VSQTVSSAVAERSNTPGQMIETYSASFAQVLPAHVKPETFVRLAQGALRRDQNLARIAKANPSSLMAALLDCARLGHDPATEAYYLVPFGNEIQGIEGWRGKVERIYRAGAVASIKAELVRKGDAFAYDPATMDRPEHTVDWFGTDRGPVIGAYAYAVMKDGATSRVVVMSAAEIDKHRKVSRGSDKPTSPWVVWYDQMTLKTVVRELEKWVPSSNEYRMEQARAMAAYSKAAADNNLPATPVSETVDGEVVGEQDWPAAAQPADAAADA